MKISRTRAAALAATLLLFPLPSQAEMVGTEGLLAQQASEARVGEVRAFMDRDDVRAQMEALGVDPALAAQRVAAMTDGELRQVAGNLDTLPAGGSDVGVVLLVLAILVLLELIGAINIFKRV